jgi:hypothetical protein
MKDHQNHSSSGKVYQSWTPITQSGVSIDPDPGHLRLVLSFEENVFQAEALLPAFR